MSVFQIKIKHLQIFAIILSPLAVAILLYSLIVFKNISPPGDEIIGDKENYIVSSMKRCYQANINVRRDCLREITNDFLDHFSIKEILAIFSKHQLEKEFFNTCHEAAHYLGQEAYKRLNSVARVYEQTDATCIGGVFHGAIEGYFMKNNISLQENNVLEIAHAVSQICDEIKNYNTPLYLTGCHHGLGHALMFVTEDDLPKALALCDNLQTDKYRSHCYTGAFMQNVQNYRSSDHPKAMIKEDDPLYPCTALNEKYQPICYTYAVLERYQGNVDKGIALCGMIPEHLRTGCFMTFGLNRTMYSDNAETLEDGCAHIKNEQYYSACVVGAAGYLVVKYGTESRLSFSFCSVVAKGSKSECYGAIGRMARSVMTNSNGIVGFCDNIPEAPHRASCMSG